MHWLPKEAIGPIIGAIVGLLGGFLTMMLTFRTQRKAEERRLRVARHEALQREVGTRIDQIARDFASAGHSMCWVASCAMLDRPFDEDIKAYETAMFTTRPKVAGGIVSIAAFDKDLHHLTTELNNELCKLDLEIFCACSEFTKSPDTAKEKLKKLLGQVQEFERRIVEDLGRAARQRNTELSDMPQFRAPGPLRER